MTIYIQDALEFMRGVADNTYGAVVTSPPYNIGVDYGVFDDKLSDRDYYDFTISWLEHAVRVSPVAVVNFGAKTSDAVALARFMLAASEVSVIQAHIVWIKSISTAEWSHGHFKPVNSKRYLTNTHESVFILSRAGGYLLDKLAVGVPYKDKSNIARRGHVQDLRDRGNVWFVPYETRQEKKTHPATFPLELAKMMIAVTGTKGRVLDPFAGSGTTMRAAAEMGLDADGVDIVRWDVSYGAAAGLG